MCKMCMKKTIVLFTVAVLFALSIMYSSKQSKTICELTLENVEAMADPEVIIEAICMGSDGICIIYPNGFFIKGTRVA